MTKNKEQNECCVGEDKNCCGCNCLDAKSVSKFLRHLAGFFDKKN